MSDPSKKPWPYLTPTRLDAGQITPDSRTPWIVIDAKEHATLKQFDIVYMIEDPDGRNWLLGEYPLELHRLADKNDQYVFLQLKLN